MEMRTGPAVAAVEPFVNAGYDLDAECDIAGESDGTREESMRRSRASKRCSERMARRGSRCRSRTPSGIDFGPGARQRSRGGRVSPDYYCMDGTIPRKRLGEVLKAIVAMEIKVRLALRQCVFMPAMATASLIMFDCNDPDSVMRAEQFGFEFSSCRLPSAAP